MMKYLMWKHAIGYGGGGGGGYMHMFLVILNTLTFITIWGGGE